VSPKNELTWGKKSIFFEFVGPQVQKMNSPWNEENNIFFY
jgi:hypothetical protein